MKHLCAAIIILILPAFILADDPPQPFIGKIIKIIDGDTITVLSNKILYRIRLAEIDAPEKKQFFGMQSKKILGDKIFHKDVKIVWSKRDLYGRIMGHVYLDDRWINKEMIEDGWAWHYKQYSKNKELALVESNAKANGKGLWADQNPIPPWEFRKNKKRLISK